MDRDETLGRISRVFLEARSLDPSARSSFLEKACAGDDELRREVESLLAHDDATLEESSRVTDPRSHIPPTIPGYRILERIGEGGMGTVWLGRQDEPVKRDVAIKVIRMGMDTNHVIARFEAERQALALMEHSGIAKVYEAGTTAQGLPYFVMEYVRGEAITTYADRMKLGLHARLDLLVQVCAAVHHAHQKGVIHRDLKPSNVLVAIEGSRPAPKVIDFGIAKATFQRLTERTLVTEVGTMVGTPEYMSPEQAEASGQDIDTRTDVYSLGVILYELLVGALPFTSWELREAGYEGIRRMIREEEPAIPSSKLASLGADSIESAKRRGMEPRTLQRKLRGDLDWITMKALEKNRDRRYQSASDLASEIERHLRSEPVLAGPPSVRYKFGKFVRRHRVGVTAALLIVLALVGGIVASTVGFVRAQRAERRAVEEAETATRVTGFLEGLFESSDPFKADRQTVTLREVLDRGAERVHRELNERPLVQSHLLGTMGRVYASLLLYDRALSLLEEAAKITEQIHGPEHPATGTALAKLATVCQEIDQPRAKALAERALAIHETALGPHHVETGRTLNAVAYAYLGTGETVKEESSLKRALAILEKSLGPDDVEIAGTLTQYAFLLRRQRRYDEAESVVLRTLSIHEKAFGVGHPNTFFSLNTLGNIYLLSRQYEKAEAAHTKGFAIFRKMYDGRPGNSIYLADAKAGLGRYDEAIALLEPAKEYAEHLKDPQRIPALAEVCSRLMLAYQARGRRADARALYERLFQKRETDDPESGDWAVVEASYWALAGNRSRALANLRRAVSDEPFQGDQLEWFRRREFASFQGDPEFEAIVAEANPNSGGT